MTDRILLLSRKILPDITRIRRRLHQNPELAFQEIETGRFIAAELVKLGIKVKRGVGKTGVVGLLNGNAEAGVVGLRADMDALPISEESGVGFASRNRGVMHACGHDSHMAMLLGAAKILSQLRDELPGTVKFIFQPSEEKNPGGAPSMIRDGVLADPKVDAIFGQHITTDLPVGKLGFRAGPLMASADEIYITVLGRGGHGAKPHEAIDPVFISAQLILALQAVISRMKDPLEPSVLTIGSIHGGTATNIIPDSVRLSGTLRTMNESWRKKALALITKTAVECARGLGGKCEVEISNGYPVLLNSEAETALASETAARLFGRGAALRVPPQMGAEDFSYFLQEVPGSFWWVGAGNKEIGATASIHSSRFKIDEAAMVFGSAQLASVAMEYLSRKDSIGSKRGRRG
jgi:amidohydrolase